MIKRIPCFLESKLRGGCKTGSFHILSNTSVSCSITKKGGFGMSFTPDEIAFLDEVSKTTFELDFLMWIEHMEEDFK